MPQLATEYQVGIQWSIAHLKETEFEGSLDKRIRFYPISFQRLLLLNILRFSTNLMNRIQWSIARLEEPNLSCIKVQNFLVVVF